MVAVLADPEVWLNGQCVFTKPFLQLNEVCTCMFPYYIWKGGVLELAHDYLDGQRQHLHGGCRELF